jgi:hypothetical protein
MNAAIVTMWGSNQSAPVTKDYVAEKAMSTIETQSAPAVCAVCRVGSGEPR